MRRFECDVCGKAVANADALKSMLRYQVSTRRGEGHIGQDRAYPIIEYCDECSQRFAAPLWVEQHNTIYDALANHAHERLLVGSTPEGETPAHD